MLGASSSRRCPQFFVLCRGDGGREGWRGRKRRKNATGTPVKESTRFSSYIDCLKAEEEDFVAVGATVVFQFLPVTAAGRDGGLDAEVVVVDNSER